MPRKSKLQTPVAPEAEENLLRAPIRPLSFEERSVLRLALKSTAFQQALRNIRNEKPSVFAPSLNDERGAQFANNRIHQIQGWEMFEVALGKQALDPQLIAPRPKENFMDESKLPLA